ncbi:exosome complex component RRP45A isoform X2 [Brassica napus]|uniref:protein RRP45A isoform X2 n=1 Tax=Brassica oleracea var. oleracea TaxID=109376 RepID=UPI0006A6AAC9|nr:PREDICTED: protein RRP45A isoform X2 [Brassica oleracea var. oleracea]XP_022552666.1 exosome complex component RRP45A isoform X2 [Brassica napus]XP_048616186.1 exosome complex component RRP45A isoform X2 [Brassica napus]
MEGRLANMWRLTVNESKFVETALQSELRVDGRGLYDYRKLTIKFGKEYGSSEVQLGHTHVMGFVTAQLVQPYKDRPNEGSLSIFTEFSPMADPSFEPGRPGEYAVELGRIIDRGLRESRAVDTESLCVLAGKKVWSVRIDLHILDNGGNLVDAANIAALAALMTFRRPDCTVGGENSQEVIIHSLEEREPLPLIIHHLPIAFTFGFFNKGNIVMDPTYVEEEVMCGRMTVTVNANGDICAIQKPGEEGVNHSVILHCLRLASSRAAATTKIIREEVEAYNREKNLQKVKRHPTLAKSEVSGPIVVVKEGHKKSSDEDKSAEMSQEHVELKTSKEQEAVASPATSKGTETRSVSSNPAIKGKTNDSGHAQKEVTGDVEMKDTPKVTKHKDGEKTLKDAVKPKKKKRKNKSS